jgi:hypothetical protein
MHAHTALCTYHITVSSAWAGGKSRLEQMVERQQNTVATLEESHIEKSALTKKNHEILRRNLLFTLGAEKKKVRFWGGI